MCVRRNDTSPYDADAQSAGSAFGDAGICARDTALDQGWRQRVASTMLAKASKQPVRSVVSRCGRGRGMVGSHDSRGTAGGALRRQASRSRPCPQTAVADEGRRQSTAVHLGQPRGCLPIHNAQIPAAARRKFKGWLGTTCSFASQLKRRGLPRAGGRDRRPIHLVGRKITSPPRVLSARPCGLHRANSRGSPAHGGSRCGRARIVMMGRRGGDRGRMRARRAARGATSRMDTAIERWTHVEHVCAEQSRS